ncbi:MarR family winged helix-turn-helix transcriptional regulator [Kocuria coralli]|nr:MarR family transcriptional regulator [Kocuria coralli]
MSFLKQRGLSDGRMGALLAISAAPGITPTELADQLEVTRATVTSLTEGLVKQGLISREMPAGDRRALSLKTTETGEQVLDDLIPELLEWLTGKASEILEQERTLTWDVLERLQRGLDETDASS